MSYLRVHPNSKNHRQSGTSLLETLIAAALLAVIAVSILPMFHRALANNVSGSDSNQATQLCKSEIEGLLGLPFDSQKFSLRNQLPTHTVESDGLGDKMTIGEFFWDPDANTEDSLVSGDHHIRIATGAWVAAETDAKGLVVWQRKSVIRQYSYADIADGVIDVNNPTQIVTLGHPMLFDVPLKKDAPDSQVNFKEEDITLESLRKGVPEFRVQFMRGF